MPIYHPDTGVLSSQEFPASEGDATDDIFEAWMEKYGDEIRSRHGANAKVLIPAVYDTPFMPCPKCGRHLCRAISAGIV